MADLDLACQSLELSLARIPSIAPWEVLGREDTVNGGTGGRRRPENGPEPELGCQVGLSHAAIFAHSWRPANYKNHWIWISKSSATQGTGFPARHEEVRRFGHTARQVRRLGKPPPLSRTFASVVVEGEMARRGEQHQSRPGKRRVEHEDWMEEDDLLGADERHEEDLRFKLQRSAGLGRGEGERQEPRGPRYDSQHRGYDRRDRPENQWRGGKGAQPPPAPHPPHHQGGYRQGKGAQGNFRGDWTEQEARKDQNREKGTWQEAPKPKGPTVCFRCREEGHHQLDCTNDPICYKCKQPGHMAAECGTNHKSKLRMFGFRFQSKGSTLYQSQKPKSNQTAYMG